MVIKSPNKAFIKAIFTAEQYRIEIESRESFENLDVDDISSPQMNYFISKRRLPLALFLLVTYQFVTPAALHADPKKNYLTPLGRRVVTGLGLTCALGIGMIGALGPTVGRYRIQTLHKQLERSTAVGLHVDASVALLPNRSDTVRFSILPPEEQVRFLENFQQVTEQYPNGFLGTVIHSIYVGQNLHNEGYRVGGLAFKDAEIVVISSEFSDSQEYQYVMHHEIIHKILDRNLHRFPHAQWKKLLPKNFAYSSSGMFMIKQGLPKETPDERRKLVERGFYDRYSTASLDEDVATLGGLFMIDDPDLRAWRKLSPLLDEKVLLIYEFLTNVDPRFFEAK